jgi:hypothetical protein
VLCSETNQPVGALGDKYNLVLTLYFHNTLPLVAFRVYILPSQEPE